MKNPGVAAVLSAILPGLGDIYNEHILAGLARMIVSAFLLIGALRSASGTVLLLYAFVWVYCIYDASNGARKHNQRTAS